MALIDVWSPLPRRSMTTRPSAILSPPISGATANNQMAADVELRNSNFKNEGKTTARMGARKRNTGAIGTLFTPAPPLSSSINDNDQVMAPTTIAAIADKALRVSARRPLSSGSSKFCRNGVTLSECLKNTLRLPVFQSAGLGHGGP